MIWLKWEDAGYGNGYERLDNFSVSSRSLTINGDKVDGTVTDAETLETFLVDRLVSGQPTVLAVSLLPGFRMRVKDMRTVDQIF